jgi:hypothetical protein
MALAAARYTISPGSRLSLKFNRGNTHRFGATKMHDFLRDADMLVTEVKSLFFNAGDAETAARIRH